MLLSRRVYSLKNTVQPYAWGSAEFIPRLLDEANPGNRPQAELWIGAHPKAPSLIDIEGEWVPLDKAIASAAEEILGASVARRFGGQLPFLLKVLAADKPLSIQAHPNLEQAREGFERENRAGIPLDAPHRNYRDANHKPELICALTPFWAMNGFRPVPEILRFLDELACPEIASEQGEFSASPDAGGLRRFLGALLSMPKERQRAAAAFAAAASEGKDEPAFVWMQRLACEYPEDIGVLSPALLNVVRLDPGQAMFLSAGELHAYMQGAGVEIMANSDNVLRGGLTPKHIDTQELLKVLTFKTGKPGIQTARRLGGSERVYSANAGEFALSMLDVRHETPFVADCDRDVEILLCTSGEAEVAVPGSVEGVRIRQGSSIFLPASFAYRIEGGAEIYRASVPRK